MDSGGSCDGVLLDLGESVLRSWMWLNAVSVFRTTARWTCGWIRGNR